MLLLLLPHGQLLLQLWMRLEYEVFPPNFSEHVGRMCQCNSLFHSVSSPNFVEFCLQKPSEIHRSYRITCTQKCTSNYGPRFLPRSSRNSQESCQARNLQLQMDVILFSTVLKSLPGEAMFGVQQRCQWYCHRFQTKIYSTQVSNLLAMASNLVASCS